MSTPICRKCGTPLIIEENWANFHTKKGHRQFICKTCWYTDQRNRRNIKFDYPLMKMATCTHCGTLLIPGENSALKSKSKRGNRQCRTCNNELKRKRVWTPIERQILNKKKRKYWRKNREKMNIQHQEREKLRPRCVSVLSLDQKSYRKVYQKKWYKKNKEHIRRRKKLRNTTNNEHVKERCRNRHAMIRDETFALLGGKCANPYGIDHSAFENHPLYKKCLQFDHIRGGGLREIKTITRSYDLIVLNSVKRGEGKYQLLCSNCNWIKRTVEGETKQKKPLITVLFEWLENPNQIKPII